MPAPVSPAALTLCVPGDTFGIVTKAVPPLVVSDVFSSAVGEEKSALVSGPPTFSTSVMLPPSTPVP